MDFEWTESQRARKRETIDFARTLTPGAGSSFPRESWKRCAEAGILKLGVPSEMGGRGDVDLITAVLMMEGMGYGCRDNGLTFALNAQIWTTQLPIAQFGSAAQRERYLPRMMAGDLIAAHALTEPEAGSDAYSLQTRAEIDGDGYRLNGMKHLVSLAPIADVFLLFATIDPARGSWGITAFLVDRDTPGVTVSEPTEKMGLRSVPMGSIRLEDCFVSPEQRLGKEGGGFAISNHSLEFERCGILASHLGAMDHQLETSVRYARKRRQFGKTIGSFQSVSNRIADMKLRLETARLLLYKVAWMKQAGQSAMLEAALLKLFLSEAFLASSMDAIRIHGGVGYLVETGAEADLRDAVGGVLYAGTSDIQRNIIAKMLGL